MEDEILENISESGETLDNTDKNLENNNEADTDVEEKKPFTVDDIEFTEEYNLGGYDFSKFKGRIDESSLPYIEEYAKRYQEQGFTQAQIEFLMEENLSETPKDRDSIMKELNTSLTMEEKQSYKYTGTQLRQALDKSNLGKYYDEIMTNPIAFKVVNALVKNMTPGANVGAKTERESRTSRLTGYQAVDKFNEYLRANIGNADVQGKVKELMEIIGTEEDKKYFKETLGL
jgi:hypothetical protein|nr:MAG TPA: hypothetical protein [Bacteriophage sp.]